tara:strand:+ start:639 stop:926 length:288 start_codon:yes stop_codon:yes gene_type:complete
MTEKKYVNGMIIKEKTFDNGGTQLKLSLKVEELINQIKELNDNGWVNLIITRRKEPSDAGVTHYAYVDTWKPTKQNNSTKKAVTSEDLDEDDLPF